jgi:hypothetical protein
MIAKEICDLNLKALMQHFTALRPEDCDFRYLLSPGICEIL